MNEIDIIRAGYEGPKGLGKSSLNNYAKCVIMHLLVSSIRKGIKPGQWDVFIGEDRLGFISTYSHSRRSRYKYTATTLAGHELDSCPNFMAALSQFIFSAAVMMYDNGTNQNITQMYFTETNKSVLMENNIMVFDGGRREEITPLDLSIYLAKGWVRVLRVKKEESPS